MNQGGILTIDLHGLNEYQAKIKLDSVFRQAGKDVYQIRVIHGCNSGIVLRDLTRTYRTREKVKRMIAGNGDTVFILREF